MNKRGFTLIELLVVIAIIAILATILYPVIVQVKEQARETVCTQNLRSMGKAIMMYVDDHDGYGLPLAPTDYNNEPNSWIVYLRPIYRYIGQPRVKIGDPSDGQPQRIWVCPGDVLKNKLALINGDRPCWNCWGSSYLYPGPKAYISPSPDLNFCKNRLAYHPKCKPRVILSWKNPKRDVLLCDFWYDFHRGLKVPKDVNNPELSPPAWVSARNVRNINMLFLDGHVQMVTPKEKEQYQTYTTGFYAEPGSGLKSNPYDNPNFYSDKVLYDQAK